MEFPGDINVFDAVDFETAVPRITGRTTVELLVQARPTGRIADHYRLAMGGSALLEAKPVLSSIFPDPKLDGFLMVYQFWCKDVAIRRNMTTSKWMDCLTLINSNTVGITDLDGNPIDGEELKRLLSKELLQHRAAIRHADAGLRSSAHQQACIRRVRNFYNKLVNPVVCWPPHGLAFKS